VDLHQIANAIPAINNFSTIAAIVCVFPTYFLYLRPATYRLILSLGITCGLTMLAIATTFFDPTARQWSRFAMLIPVVVFSPLDGVLIAMLARIRSLNRVGLWSTVVLACVVLNWAGIFVLVLVLQS
jgi:hypothetical protein